MLSGNSSVDLKFQPTEVVPPAVPKQSCSLRWRQGKLWVSATVGKGEIPLPAFASPQWFQACLMRSQATAVCIDPELGQSVISFWANACKDAGKLLFLRVPSRGDLPQKQSCWTWLLKRSCDRLAAAAILLALMPLMLLIAGLIRLQDGGPVFYSQWRVGERGKLFRIIKFRSMTVNAEQNHHQVIGQQIGLHKLKDDPRITPLGKWLRKFSLDELPQLLNVLRGEMSLVGPRPWALYDALRVDPKLRGRLNALPGITGAWQVGARSHEVDLDKVNRIDLTYLQQWSLTNDLRILLMTVPKVMLGTGAY